MKFDKPAQVDAVCYQMRLGDFARGKNRALINSVFNGAPPIPEEDAEKSGVEVNINFLEGPRLAHDGRSQFYQNFLKPGYYFHNKTDSGNPQKRQEYSSVVTHEMNKIMKKSIPYVECFRSKFAQNILHGIAPTIWEDKHRWRPKAIGIEDVFVPANVLLTMDNLPFFALRRSFTAPELIRLTRGPKVDKAWNKKMVEACIKWVDDESSSLMSSNWPEVWSPEKIQERIKGDGGFYVGDAVPTVDVFDFYFWSDEGGVQGWRRRMILDAWSSPTMGSDGKVSASHKDGVFKDFRSDFLYNPGDRVFCTDRQQIINWQFADLSAVAPFRYHSVRSLGFLLYAVCNLQNRLRSKFTESVFEQMLIYFRVNSQEDYERALKVDMVNRGFIDSSIDFVKAGDRYQVNAPLVEMGLRENANLIAQNSSSYTSNPNQNSRSNVEKTKFEVMAEVNAMTSLVSSALTQAYIYQTPEYTEISRRFMIKDSRDPEVRTFQANCLRRGVPASVLYNPACWEQEPVRVMGAGNKTLEMAIAEQLMQYRNLYDPGAQRKILRDVTLAITDDADRAEDLVPMQPGQITDSVHDAQLAVGTLMFGLPVKIKDGTNNIEYIDTLMATLAMLIQKQANNLDEVMGMQNIATHIAERIQLLSQDPQEKQRVQVYNKQLSALMNALKAQGQQLMKAQEEQGQQGGGMDPESAAKIQAQQMQAQVKAQNSKESHALKTAQRQIQFEMQQTQERRKFEQQFAMQQAEARLKLEKATAEAAIDIKKKKKKAAESSEQGD